MYFVAELYLRVNVIQQARVRNIEFKGTTDIGIVKRKFNMSVTIRDCLRIVLAEY